MKRRLVLSDELIEKMANAYRHHLQGQTHTKSITFEQYMEKEIVRLKKDIA